MPTAKRIPIVTLAPLLLFVGANFVSAQSPSPALQQIAWAHAPFVLQETGTEANVGALNQLLAVNFDGDNIGSNNRVHSAQIQNFNGRAIVYYSITETNDAYYIGYYFYHANDGGVRFCWDWFGWGTSCHTFAPGHENDMEGYWVAVLKSPLNPFGVATVSLTVAHGALIPSYSASYYDPPGPQVWLETGPASYPPLETFHWVDQFTSFLRPVMMIREGTHATYPAQDRGGTRVQDPGCGPAGSDLCGIWPHDFVSNGNYTASSHNGDAHLITYQPYPNPSCGLSGCGVLSLPSTQASGHSWYDLVSMVDSPLWTTRSSPGMMYKPYTNPPGGTVHFVNQNGSQGDGVSTELGFPCFNTAAGDCGAQPPWSWAGGTIGASCWSFYFYGPYCWYRFGIDNTMGGGASHQFKAIGGGALLVAPVAVMDSIWHMNGLSSNYLYDPFVRDGTPPSLSPPDPPYAGINGNTIFSDANQWGDFSATVTGNNPPYTLTWYADPVGERQGDYFSFQVLYSQYVYLDVSDARGQHFATQLYLQYCAQGEELCLRGLGITSASLATESALANPTPRPMVPGSGSQVHQAKKRK